MLTRSLLRLWTPKYFRGQNEGVRRLGPRSIRVFGSKSTAAAATPAPPNPKRPAHSPAQQSDNNGSPFPRAKRFTQPLSSPSLDTTTTPVALDPLVLHAQKLLVQLSRPAPSSSSSSSSPTAAMEATWSFVSFTARRDIFGPLRHRLPAAPAHKIPMPLRDPTRSSSSAATPRLRPVPFGSAPPPTKAVTAAAPSPSSSSNAERLFTLAELTVLLQLYDAVEADEGQVLVQLLAEVQQRLSELAAAHRKGGRPDTHPSQSDSRKGDVEEKKSQRAREAVAAHLPFPALLFALSSLGVVEEATLDLLTSAAPIDTMSPARRGLLFRQLPTYSAEELVLLVVALHRFGHAMQPSMKAVVKSLRASQYNTATPAGVFHRRMRGLKKRLLRSSQEMKRIPTDGDPGGVTHVPDALPSDEGEEGRSLVRAIQRDTELQSLVLALRCPMLLLKEALTALSLTVYRRADVVTLLSDWIAVTAVMELTEAMGAAATTSSPSSTPHSFGDYALLVAHQLLRAAKLTEEMEQPQPLLSEVFAWSCTLTGNGVVVDGGEDSEVPSDRVAFYDHVTADLVKLNRTD